MQRFINIKPICFSGIFLIVSACATTPKIPLDDSYERIFEIQNSSKDKLYTEVNAWFVETFKSAESIIEFQDKEEGRVMGKYVFKARNVNSYYRTIISVDIKENRVRIKFYDPNILVDPIGSAPRYKPISSYGTGTRNTFIRNHLSTEWYLLAESLKLKLAESDEW